MLRNATYFDLVPLKLVHEEDQMQPDEAQEVREKKQTGKPTTHTDEQTGAEQVRVTRAGNVLTICIDRPKALNSLSKDVLTKLVKVLRVEHGKSDTRGLLLTGGGTKAFIAGADISEMQAMTAEEAQAFSALGQEATCLIEQLPIPTIACVQGYALGGGCELALACDLIFATDKAVFGQPEVHLGIIPGFGGCVRLPLRIGVSRAKDLIYSGRKVRAEEALAIGLADKLFADHDQMLQDAHKFLHGISAKTSSEAIAIAKRVVHRSRDISPALAFEREGFADVFATDNRREGVDAFMEKRPPKFS